MICDSANATRWRSWSSPRKAFSNHFSTRGAFSCTRLKFAPADSVVYAVST